MIAKFLTKESGYFLKVFIKPSTMRHLEHSFFILRNLKLCLGKSCLQIQPFIILERQIIVRLFKEFVENYCIITFAGMLKIVLQEE